MCFNCYICIPDDFNRVILSMRRGQEFTDYINASFIDVSTYRYQSLFSLLPHTARVNKAEDVCFAVP